MAGGGTVTVKITGDASHLQKALGDSDSMLGSWSSKVGGAIGTVGKVAAIGAAAVGGLAVAVGKQAVDAFMEAERVSAQTEAVIKSTGGAAGVTAKQVDDLANNLSMMAGVVDDEAVKAGENMLLTFCLEESAEALTKDRGWVGHRDLRAGDEILAYDPETGEALWEPVTSMHRFQVKGDLVRWRSRQIDVATTPAHRWWTTARTTLPGRVSGMQPHRFRTTEEVSGSQFAVMIGGGSAAGFADEPTLGDDLVELLGWVMTEGWYVKPDTPGHVSVGFCQSETANAENVASIRAMVASLRDAGHRISETSRTARYNDSTMLSWNFAGKLSRRVHELLPAKKLTPTLFGMLTAKQAELLLDILIAGDGHTDKNGGRSFIQKDAQQLGAVAMLCAMLGIRTTIGRRPDQLILTTTNYAWGHQVHARPEAYDGIVWCPHLRTGIFMARCNGRTFWTGNTQIQNRAGDGNDIFNQATESALDMSVAMGEDMTASSIRLGKALQDPVAGVGALRKVGVRLSEQQEKQVKDFMAVNDVAGAQKIILGELQTEFGGSAKAAGGTLAGALGRLKTIWGNLLEQVGEKFAPVIIKVSEWLGKHLPAAVERVTGWFGRMWHSVEPVIKQVGNLIDLFSGGFDDVDDTAQGFGEIMDNIFGNTGDHVETFRKLFLGVVDVFEAVSGWFTRNRDTIVGTLQMMADLAGGAVRLAFEGIAKAVGFVKDNFDWLAPVAAGLLTTFLAYEGYVKTVAAIEAATKLWAAAQAAVNLVMNTNPIILAITVIVGLTAALVTAYKTSDTFREHVDKALDLLQASFGRMAAVAVGALRLLIVTALDWAEQTTAAAAYAFGWVPELGPKLEAAHQAVKTMKDNVNQRLGEIQNKFSITAEAHTQEAIQQIQYFKDAVLSVPNIVVTEFDTSIRTGVGAAVPGFASGGTASGWAMVGEKGPELAHFGQPTRIFPSGTGPAGATYNVTVNAGMGADGGQIGAQVVTAIKEYERRNGTQWRN